MPCRVPWRRIRFADLSLWKRRTSLLSASHLSKQRKLTYWASWAVLRISILRARRLLLRDRRWRAWRLSRRCSMHMSSLPEIWGSYHNRVRQIFLGGNGMILTKTNTTAAKFTTNPNQSIILTFVHALPLTVDGGITIAITTITTSVTGTTNQKHHRHEARCVNAPPIRGPMPLPKPTMAPMKPLYLPRCSRVVMSLAIIITSAVLPSSACLREEEKGGNVHGTTTKPSNRPKSEQHGRILRKPGTQIRSSQNTHARQQ